MIIFRDRAEIPADFGPSAVAIGKFDGVHIGHRAVIEKLKTDAAATGARAVAVTFDRNPLALLRPELCPENVVSLERKLELLAELELDAVLVLTFDEALASLEPVEFVEDFLVDALGATTVLVGEDFRFGHRGSGTPDLLVELGTRYGFTVDVVGEVLYPEGNRRISSTWVRSLLAEGDVATTAGVLGRPVTVRGEVVHGHKRGRELGFPTANLAPITDSVVPADGVYAGWLIDHDTDTRYPAAISVGTNPTFDDVPERQVEAHVLGDEWLELYGHDVSIEFTQRLRGMVAFEGIEALKQTMAADVTEARAILG